MKKKTIIKVSIVVLILLGLHFITYSVDSKMVSASKDPIFSIRSKPAIKDGGSAIYYGFGYQVIRWHKIEQNTGRRLLGYEIHRIPLFKKFNDGPDKNVKYVDYYSHK